MAQADERDRFMRALELAPAGEPLPDNPDAVLPVIRRYRFEPRADRPTPIDVEDYALSHVTSTRARHLLDVMPTLWLLRLGTKIRPPLTEA
jgi:ATP-dependent Clp protease ATP-binding subunit ClpA/ATP-dependent Clp protease ATP-binding subunit ClpC